MEKKKGGGISLLIHSKAEIAARGVQISLDGIDRSLGLADTNAKELPSGGGNDVVCLLASYSRGTQNGGGFNLKAFTGEIEMEVITLLFSLTDQPLSLLLSRSHF